MKNTLLVLIFAIVIASVVFGVWASRKSSPPNASTHSSTNSIASVRPEPVNSHPAPAHFLMANEWQELRNAREITLRNNPDLAAEYKALLQELDKQQKQLEAAMIKADPKVAPMVAKLELLRQRNTVPSGPSSAR